VPGRSLAVLWSRYRLAGDSGPGRLAAHPLIQLSPSTTTNEQRRARVELHSLADIPESTEQVPRRCIVVRQVDNQVRKMSTPVGQICGAVIELGIPPRVY
jgi:hypothetical protein